MIASLILMAASLSFAAPQATDPVEDYTGCLLENLPSDARGVTDDARRACSALWPAAVEHMQASQRAKRPAEPVRDEAAIREVIDDLIALELADRAYERRTAQGKTN